MKKTFTVVALLFLSLALAGCGSGRRAGPTAGPESAGPTAAETPSPAISATPAPTKTQEPIAIQAQRGSLTIVAYGFAPSLSDWEPESGYRLLLLRMESTGGAYAGGEGLLEETEGAYVVGNDRSTTFRGACCLAGGGLVIGFVTPSTASTFTLFWPGNPPIALTHPQRPLSE
jgi:predicted small lipoprotein YifL